MCWQLICQDYGRVCLMQCSAIQCFTKACCIKFRSIFFAVELFSFFEHACNVEGDWINILPVKTLKFVAGESMWENPCLFEFLQWLLGPKNKLQWDVFTVTVLSTAGAQNMLSHFLQRGRADDPRMTQSGHNLILQQPANLKHKKEVKSKKKKKITWVMCVSNRNILHFSYVEETKWLHSVTSSGYIWRKWEQQFKEEEEEEAFFLLWVLVVCFPFDLSTSKTRFRICTCNVSDQCQKSADLRFGYSSNQKWDFKPHVQPFISAHKCNQ